MLDSNHLPLNLLKKTNNSNGGHLIYLSQCKSMTFKYQKVEQEFPWKSKPIDDSDLNDAISKLESFLKKTKKLKEKRIDIIKIDSEIIVLFYFHLWSRRNKKINIFTRPHIQRHCY